MTISEAHGEDNQVTFMSSEATQIRLPQRFIPVYHDIDPNYTGGHERSVSMDPRNAGQTIDKWRKVWTVKGIQVVGRYFRDSIPAIESMVEVYATL